MPAPTLLLSPDQNGYQAVYGQATVSTELDGGAGRYRADQLGAAFKVPLQWTCNQTNYNYLTAFYRQLTFGADPFIIGLFLDSAAIQTYTAHFVPRTFRLAAQQGATWVVTATIEVIPDPSYYVNDAAIVAAGPDV